MPAQPGRGHELMLTETTHREVRVKTLSAQFPLEPLTNEYAYHRAIAILDRLFLMRREKNREELAYFRALAQMASDYECENA
jgi:hypothetical protein